jgi:DNA-binding response OmpR family regulator
MTSAPAWPRSSANADATPSSSSTSSTRMALMLNRVGQNLIDFGLLSLVRTEFPRLRDSDGAVVLGLRAGADDYLVKPVRKAVLLARIEAVMRRLRRVAGDTAAPSGPVVAGPVTIDRERREVTLAGTTQALTRTEFQLLATLAGRLGEAVSREELMLEVWGTAVVGRSRSLDFFIGQIRAKLAGLPLHTVRGFGFRLDA